MNITRRLFMFVLGCLTGCKDESVVSESTPRAASANRPPLLEELDSLPVGLHVTHTPAEVNNPVGPDEAPKAWKYRWIFKTEVAAIERPLKIEQFGILAWDGEQWILPPDQSRYNSGVLDGQMFADWFGQPGARIEPGKPAADPQNWAGSHDLADFQQKWFFIGSDASGKRCKGEGVIRLRGIQGPAK